MTNVDLFELLKAIIQLLTILAPIVVSLFGIWRIVIKYWDKRATAKEREHEMDLELQQAKAKRDAEAVERDDAQREKLTEAMTLLIQSTAARDARMETLAAIVKTNNDNLGAQTKVLADLAKSISQLATGDVTVSRKLDEQAALLTTLQARVGVANQLAEDRNEWAKETTRVVDKQAAVMTEQAGRIQELKEQVAALEKDMRVMLTSVLSSLELLTQTDANEGIEINKIEEKLDAIDTLLKSFIETYKINPKSEPPAPATGAVQAIEKKAEPPNEGHPPKEKPSDNSIPNHGG